MLKEGCPFYELRFYAVAPGRMKSMSSRFSEHLNRIFPNNGIYPIGGWCVESGAGMPSFIYMVPWKSYEEREKALASFFSDPDWADARALTNGPSQLVERYDIFFLKRIDSADEISTIMSKEPGLYELVVQSVANDGRVSEITDDIINGEIPAYSNAGAEVIGCFQMMVGPNLPKIVTLLKWDSADSRQDGLQSIENDPEREGARTKQILEHGRCNLGHADRYVMSFVPVDWGE